MRSILTTVLLNFLVSFSYAQQCPNLDGRFREDDYGMTIHQTNCDQLSLDGSMLFERYDFNGIVPDGMEHLCFEDAKKSAYCTSEWLNDELHLYARYIGADGKPYGGDISMHITRCDLTTEANCTYGPLEKRDILRINHNFGRALIPRGK